MMTPHHINMGWLARLSFKSSCYLTLSLRAGCNSRSIFKQSPADFNSVFLLLDQFPYQAKEPSQPYYLPIVGEQKDVFKPYPWALSRI